MTYEEAIKESYKLLRSEYEKNGETDFEERFKRAFRNYSVDRYYRYNGNMCKDCIYRVTPFENDGWYSMKELSSPFCYKKKTPDDCNYSYSEKEHPCIYYKKEENSNKKIIKAINQYWKKHYFEIAAFCYWDNDYKYNDKTENWEK